METLEAKIRQGMDINSVVMHQRVQIAREHVQHAESVHQSHKQAELSNQLEKAQKGFERVLRSEKNKKELDKMVLDQIRLRRLKYEEKVQQAKLNLQDVKRAEQEKYQYLQQKNNQRAKLINEIKEALREDIEQKKEIYFLKKKDQLENYERGKNFQQLLKHKLVESLLEKKERAERVKQQQKRIASICGTQRIRAAPDSNGVIQQSAQQILKGGIDPKSHVRMNQSAK
uniref:Uncharacterized protein n=1 Tax=Strombidium rassoulzadegani TaxID=1082188 RepID=A0A7S3CKU3_9SPIT|mmetsp:Transcript_14434/g.24623  ORF Transcript_14434/g.24623 Transcript_14434/m.24623 type:complete len:229 (+) Transcript_14434:917-1603(+)